MSKAYIMQGQIVTRKVVERIGSMKIVGISCSPRKEKTTRQALEVSLRAAREKIEGVETVVIDLAGKNINGCIACGKCKKELGCSQEDDFIELIPILSDPDIAGMIVATPVYFQCMSSQCKAFLDRAVMFRRNGFLFGNRVGGVLAVGAFRNGGQELTIQSVHAAMLCQDMVIVSDGKPNAHLGGTLVSDSEGKIDDDKYGLESARNVGTRLAEVAAKIFRPPT